MPVPKTFVLCEDDAIVGSMFYVMEYKEGLILWDPLLPDAADNAERSAIYDAMNQTMAALHNVDVDAVGLTSFGRPGNYFERQLNRWSTQYRASETCHIASMESLMTWLVAKMPEDDGTVTLVHGDYRLDNMMFGGPYPLAVVDWQSPAFDCALGDVSYFMGTSIIEDERGKLEEELVRQYFNTLSAYNVSMNWDECWHYYRG